MESEIRNQLFTQLHVNLVRGNIEYKKDTFEVNFKFNDKLAEKFLSDIKMSPTCYLEPVNVFYDKESKIMSFIGQEKDFSSIKDFNGFLSKTIKDNDLSLIRLKKSNVFKSWIQDKFLKSEVDFYKLDEMYEKAEFMPPIIKRNEENGLMRVDAGGELKYELSEDNIVCDLVHKMNDLMNKLENKTTLKKESKSKNKIR